MNDPIIDEIRKVREAHASRLNRDLDAIFCDIKEREKQGRRKFVSFPPRKAEPNQVLLPTAAAIPAAQDSSPLPGVPTS
jgi:hypothetical protein